MGQKSLAPKKLARMFRALGQPARLRILLAIGDGEACVCHLEAALKMRQAYISQQLMALREVDLVETRREGRNIFYRLQKPGFMKFIEQAARFAGIEEAEIHSLQHTSYLPNCSCPHCEPLTLEHLSVRMEEIA